MWLRQLCIRTSCQFDEEESAVGIVPVNSFDGGEWYHQSPMVEHCACCDGGGRAQCKTVSQRMV